MKTIHGFLLLGVLWTCARAQQLPVQPHPALPATPATARPNQFTRLDRFYQKNGTMQMTVHPDFATALFSYFHEPASQRAFGIISGIAPINQTIESGNGLTAVQTRALLFPVWLSVKIRLTNNPTANFVPYLIGGLGPSFALDFGPNRQVNLNLADSNFLAGGSAFAGAGVDYLWAQGWAVSADLRYIVLRYPTAVAGRTNLDGLSFSIGIVHGFGL